VFVSAVPAAGRELLLPLAAPGWQRRLAREQPYGASQAGWRAFLQAASALPAFELRRAEHPAHAVTALAAVLGVPPHQPSRR
jgi:hypothetical protein